MKCILHVGTEKTGTSTIQAFLDLNRDLLRWHKILFTQSAGRRNNRDLSVAAYNLTNIDDYAKSKGLRTATKLSNYQSQVIDSLRREIDQAKSGGLDTVCFSSEHFHSRLRTDGEVERLHAILKNLGIREITVVIYLREQAALVTSLYSTAVLFGGRTTSPPEPNEAEYWDDLCNHKESIQRFQKAFGAKSVKPRLFSKEDFVGDSLVTDFLYAAGIDLPKDKLRFPERENESISWFGLEVLRRLNVRQPMYLDDGAHNPIRAGVPHFFQSAFKKGKKFKLSTEIANRWQAAYESSNEWVRQEYFPDREKLFLSTSQGCNQVLGIGDCEIDQMADLLNSILIARPQAGDSLSGGALLNIIMRKSQGKLKELTRRCTQRR
jgi:hypothetical protein